MATTEEVQVLVKAVGDASGLQPVTNALSDIQKQAQGLQDPARLATGIASANAALSKAMAGSSGTMADFQRNFKAIQDLIGSAPTLKPEAFGIGGETASAAADGARKVAEAGRTAATATTEVSHSAAQGETNFLRFGLALVGAGSALSIFTKAGELARDAAVAVVQGAVAQEQALRSNTIALGEQAAGYQAWATSVSQAAGVTTQSLLEAGTAAQQFGRQAGFGPEQVQNLVALSTVLAQIHGTDVGQTMNTLTAALQGNAQAANALDLQLDAATISYQQFGDATGEVFGMLDPSTQATLRYEAALGQLHNQVSNASGPVLDLQNAQGKLNTEWEQFVRSTGPGVVTALGNIVGGANAAIDAFQRLNNLTIQRNQQAGASDEGFKNEQALLQGLTDRLDQQTARLRGELGQNASDLGTLVSQQPVIQRLAEQTSRLRNDVGNDFNDLGTAVRQATDAAGQGIDNLRQQAGQLVEAIAAPLRAADAADRAAASQAQQGRDEQLKALAAQVADPLAALGATRQNQATAAQAQVQYQRQLVDLTADEAQIRLQMLPNQQRMLELQNQTSRAQIEATQRSLPSSRALQDLQNRIEEDRLIATSGGRSIAERTAAQLQGAGLVRQLPEAQLAALRGQEGTLPSARAAQDLGLVSQLQGLDLQQALFPDQFRVDMLTLLSKVADAAQKDATRDIATINAIINTTITQTAGPLTADDEKRIVGLTSDAFAAQLHAAVQKANTGASSQLAGAGP